MPLSLQEGYSQLQKATWKHFNNNKKPNCFTDDVKYRSNFICDSDNRQITGLIYRLKLNAFKTKYSQNIKCICGKEISPQHILYKCKALKPFLPEILTQENCVKPQLQNIFANHQLMFTIAKGLLKSPVGILL